MFIKTILTAINNLYLLSIYVKFIGLSIFIFVLKESGHVEGTLPSSPNFQYTCEIKKKININCTNFQFENNTNIVKEYFYKFNLLLTSNILA